MQPQEDQEEQTIENGNKASTDNKEKRNALLRGDSFKFFAFSNGGENLDGQKLEMFPVCSILNFQRQYASCWPNAGEKDIVGDRPSCIRSELLGKREVLPGDHSSSTVGSGDFGVFSRDDGSVLRIQDTTFGDFGIPYEDETQLKGKAYNDGYKRDDESTLSIGGLPSCDIDIPVINESQQKVSDAFFGASDKKIHIVQG
jgi:hypothetical protein